MQKRWSRHNFVHAGAARSQAGPERAARTQLGHVRAPRPSWLRMTRTTSIPAANDGASGACRGGGLTWGMTGWGTHSLGHGAGVPGDLTTSGAGGSAAREAGQSHEPHHDAVCRRHGSGIGFPARLRAATGCTATIGEKGTVERDPAGAQSDHAELVSRVIRRMPVIPPRRTCRTGSTACVRGSGHRAARGRRRSPSLAHTSLPPGQHRTTGGPVSAVGTPRRKTFVGDDEADALRCACRRAAGLRAADDRLAPRERSERTAFTLRFKP